MLLSCIHPYVVPVLYGTSCLSVPPSVYIPFLYPQSIYGDFLGVIPLMILIAKSIILFPLYFCNYVDLRLFSAFVIVFLPSYVM